MVAHPRATAKGEQRACSSCLDAQSGGHQQLRRLQLCRRGTVKCQTASNNGRVTGTGRDKMHATLAARRQAGDGSGCGPDRV